MKEKHIIELLEKGPLAVLTEAEQSEIAAHTDECEPCRKAFTAASLASTLLHEHAAQAFVPPPFFEARVVALWRERQKGNDAWAFGRLWRASGALVSSMAATVALLAVLSFALPTDQAINNANVVSAANGYSAEEIMLNVADPADDQASDAQVLKTLYATDEEVAK